MSRNSKLFALILLISVSGTTYGQNYYFRNFSAEDGLPSNTVTCAIQDSRGFMWFGTKDGICRYDGAVFRLFGDEEAQEGMNGMTQALCEDGNGMIWFSTSKAFGLYNPFTGEVTTCMSGTGARSSLLCDANSAVWFLNNDGTVLRFPQGDPARREEIECSFQPFVACMDANGTLWCTSRDGHLYRYDVRNGFEKHFPFGENSGEKIRHLASYDNNNIVFSTDNSRIYSYDVSSGRCECIIPGFPESASVNCIKAHGKGELWIGCLQGLYIYRKGEALTGPIKDDHVTSIQNTNITSLCTDRDRNMWICTYHGGISLWHNRRHHVSQFIQLNGGNSLKGKLVRAICGDGNSDIWVGTEDGHLNLFKPGTRTVKDVHKAFGLKEELNYHCFLNEGGRMWVATFNDGVYLLDKDKVRIIRHYDFSGSSCICIRKTSDGSIYAGTSAGMFRYDRVSDNFVRYGQIPEVWIHDIFEDSEGTVWIGSFGTGIYYKDRNSTSFVNVKSGTDGLECNFILNFFEDNSGRMWIATEGGGVCHTRVKGQKVFSHVDRKDGMPSNISCAIVQDRKGMLWISTTKGLVEFDPETERIRHIYHDSNNIVGDNFCYGASFVSGDGQIHLGTTKGLVKINPEFLAVRNESKPVYIVDVRAGVKGRISSLHEEGKSTMMSENIKVKSRDISYLSISFASPDFSDIPTAPEYEYSLMSRKRETRALTRDHTVVFSDLRPGHYSFTLRLAGTDDPASSRTITIDILPPAWQSPWALAAYTILALAFLAYGIMQARKKNERERQHEMYKMEAAKQKEIADAKIGFFTNITHEIRTPLSLIKMPIEKIIAEKEYTEASKEDIMTIQANTNRLLNLTNQLLDIRMIEKKEFVINPSKFELTAFIKNLAKRFSPGIRERHLSYTEHLGDADIEVCTDAEFLEKIVCNLLSNAVKYGKSNISITLRHDRDNICIIVNSDGEIIQESEAEQIFKPFYQIKTVNSYLVGSNGTGLGLPYARQLANALGGRLYLDTSNREVNSFIHSGYPRSFGPAFQRGEGRRGRIPRRQGDNTGSRKPLDTRGGGLRRHERLSVPAAGEGIHRIVGQQRRGGSQYHTEQQGGSGHKRHNDACDGWMRALQLHKGEHRIQPHTDNTAHRSGWRRNPHRDPRHRSRRLHRKAILNGPATCQHSQLVQEQGDSIQPICKFPAFALQQHSGQQHRQGLYGQAARRCYEQHRRPEPGHRETGEDNGDKQVHTLQEGKGQHGRQHKRIHKDMPSEEGCGDALYPEIQNQRGRLSDRLLIPFVFRHEFPETVPPVTFHLRQEHKGQLNRALRNGVIAAASPGMAAQYPAQRKPEALQGTVFAECLQRILAAGGRKTAGRRFQRRYAQLIEFYQQYERSHKYATQSHIIHGNVCQSCPAPYLWH